MILFRTIICLFFAHHYLSALDYSDVIGTYRLDIDEYIKLNRAIGFTYWANAPEEQIRKEIADSIGSERFIFEKKRVIETIQSKIHQPNLAGDRIKSIYDDSQNGLMVMIEMVDPGENKTHRFYRFFKR